MDTHIVYPGQIPQDTDLLLAQKLMALSVGGLGDALFGRTVAAWGFSPTLSPEALTVSIDAGVILASGPILPTALGGQGGGLPADATVTTKQYLLPSAQTLTIPGTGGTYTLYALCSDVDTDNTLLPFWSADNPTQTQAGPNNAGTQLATRRTSQVVLTLAQSAPAAPANGSVIPLMTFAVPSGATNASGVTYSKIADMFWMTIPEIQNLVLANEPGRFLGSEIITEDGSYTIPTGAKLLKVMGVAPGGAGGYAEGGGSTQGAVSAGGAGGAGSFIEFEMDLTKFAGLTSIPLTVGVAGVATYTTQSGSATNATFNGTDIVLEGGHGGYYGPLTTSTAVNASGAGGQISIGSQLYKIRRQVSGGFGQSGMALNGTTWPATGVGTPMGGGTGNAAVGRGGSGQGAGASGAGGGSGYGQSNYLGGDGAPGAWIIEAYS